MGCQKPKETKNAMKKVHEDLMDRGYMKKLADMPEHVREMIRNAPVVHYHPWRAVHKDDSLSTPVRLVVDPSMTKLNWILAKGENRISRSNEILVRCRLKKFAFSTDITKMYNTLILEETAYPYSLFIYHPSMDEEVEPEIYVMTVAWYGVTSTGSQAGYAIEKIVEELGSQYPEA